MKFTVASVLAATAAVVSASPCAAPKPQTEGTNTATNNDAVFTLRTAKSGGDMPVQNRPIIAVNRSLAFGPLQNASAICDGPVPGAANFMLQDGRLKLYTKDEEQTVSIDASGMGQGNVHYLNGPVPPSNDAPDAPTNAQDKTKTFSLSADGGLEFLNEPKFQACPGQNDTWYIWYKVVDKPAGQEGCVDVLLKSSPSEQLVKCQYSNDAAK
ncbi:hypothetical protein IAQ61_010446 [Plenodomus lingam]|uniref:uncharacterized protein n=1 Tax=Leptosphaeria maculans TaxID=5022 RepID=UPI00332B648D|nr:hypothetical protein IAQ61_010446 [Plenodomus lingam]